MPPALAALRADLARHPPFSVARRPWLRRAAVAIVLVPSADDVRLVLIARAVRERDPWSGDLAFPGGLAADVDPDAVATARREAFEEVGIELGAALGRLSDRLTLAPGTRSPMRVRPMIFVRETLPELVLAPNEVARVYTPSLRELDATPRREITRRIGPVPMRFAGRVVGDHTLWGLTGSMIEELTQRIARAGRPRWPLRPSAR